MGQHIFGKKPVPLHRHISGEQVDMRIVLTFVNACGIVCPPTVIHKGTHVNQSWLTK